MAQESTWEVMISAACYLYRRLIIFVQSNSFKVITINCNRAENEANLSPIYIGYTKLDGLTSE